MRPIIALFAVVLAVGCHGPVSDAGPQDPAIEVRVLRQAPGEPLITLGHHEEEPYVDAKFVVIAPEKLKGRAFRLKIVPASCGALFEASEFRLRLPESAITGKDPQRQNPDGTTTVFATSFSHWDFSRVMLEAVKETNQSPNRTQQSGVGQL